MIEGSPRLGLRSTDLHVRSDLARIQDSVFGDHVGQSPKIAHRSDESQRVGAPARGERAKGNALRNRTERRDGRTHSPGVAPGGILGYIGGGGVDIFVPFLNLLHRILVAGDTVHHICNRIFTPGGIVVRC
jgi:hypothetical protein